MNEEIHVTPHRISVIIPIYNCEDYLEECVRSLFEQTWKDIEYIFIDDASTDNSMGILNNMVSTYPEREPSVRIIRHKENKGISFSRMEGVRLSKGDMIIHCDSDDVLEKNSYELMINSAVGTKAEIVGCGFRIFGDVPYPVVSDLFSGAINADDLLGRIAGSNIRQIHGALWNKLIMRYLWNDVHIPEGLSYCEDVFALFQILSKKPRVSYLDKALYNYRIRKGSLISDKDKVMDLQCDTLIPELCKLKSNMDSQFKSAVDSKIIGLLYRLLKSGSVTMQSLSLKYGTYRAYINKNKQLNLLEKLHLRLALNGSFYAAFAIGKFNEAGYRIIKWLRKNKF